MCKAVQEVRDKSSGQNASDADSYIKRLMAFKFLISAVICQHVLQYTRPLNACRPSGNKM